MALLKKKNKKRRFMVVSGFLGAGKTTSMIAFAEYYEEKYGKAGIIANDLGAKHLVDKEYTSKCGRTVTEVTGGCICYQTETLIDKIKRLSDIDGAEFVMSDIPGCGVGALDHVYHKLNDEYLSEVELAPFTVITDPERLRTIMPEKADINLPTEMQYLFKSQLAEADVVVLNKIDLLTEEDVVKYIEFLKSFCPGTPVFAISAKERKNIGDVVDYIKTHNASLKKVDIGYGGKDFIAAEGKLSWYNRKFFLSSDDDIDGNAFIKSLLTKINEKLREVERNVPHMKAYASTPDGDDAKASVVGIDNGVQFDLSLSSNSKKLSVILNARAACEPSVFEKIANDAMNECVEEIDASCQVFFTECFGMMDEGM